MLYDIYQLLYDISQDDLWGSKYLCKYICTTQINNFNN